MDQTIQSFDNLSGYLREIFFTVIQTDEMENNKNTITLRLPESFLSKLDFGNITNNDKIELFYIGLKQAAEVFENNIINDLSEDDTCLIAVPCFTNVPMS